MNRFSKFHIAYSNKATLHWLPVFIAKDEKYLLLTRG
jgi:hypothetical protein